MTRKEYELNSILERHEDALRSKIKDAIINEYTNTVLEIERKNVGAVKCRGKESSNVRIDYFTRSIFMYMFSKLHKGDRLTANRIANELLNMSMEV